MPHTTDASSVFKPAVLMFLLQGVSHVSFTVAKESEMDMSTCTFEKLSPFTTDRIYEPVVFDAAGLKLVMLINCTLSGILDM